MRTISPCERPPLPRTPLHRITSLTRIKRHTGSTPHQHLGYGTPPSCPNYQNYRFVVNPSNASGQALLAIVLSAVARGASVGITGSGTCSIWPDTESILLLQSN
jgi:hypothetical protein